MYLSNSVLKYSDAIHAASYRKHREHSMFMKQWNKSKNDQTTPQHLEQHR